MSEELGRDRDRAHGAAPDVWDAEDSRPGGTPPRPEGVPRRKGAPRSADEILDAVRPLDLPQKSAMELAQLLREADLVKFAKATPEATRNIEAYQWAYYFVEETKPVEEQPVPEAEEALGVKTKEENHA